MLEAFAVRLSEGSAVENAAVDASKPRSAFEIAFGLWLTTVLVCFGLWIATGLVALLASNRSETDFAPGFALGFVLASAHALQKHGDRRTAFAVSCVAAFALASASLCERALDGWSLDLGLEDTPSVFIVALLAAWVSKAWRHDLPRAFAWASAGLGVAAVLWGVGLMALRPAAMEALSTSNRIASVVVRELPAEDEALEVVHDGRTLRVFHGEGDSDHVVWETDGGGERTGFDGASTVSFHLVHDRLIVLGDVDGRRRIIAVRSWPQAADATVARGELGMWAPSWPSLAATVLACLVGLGAVLRLRRSALRSRELSEAVPAMLRSGDVVVLEDGSEQRVSACHVGPGPVGVVVSTGDLPATYREAEPPRARVVCGPLYLAREENARESRVAAATAIAAGLTAAWLAAVSTIL